jgi:16S rRNA (guanine966-N2)-methyltransferase
MRVIAGRHKGRNLAAPKGRATRPTAARAREGLFNMLAHGGFGTDDSPAIDRAVVLEAFAGSGAFAFEALSRGAAHATLLDLSEPALDAARDNAEMLGEGPNTTIRRMDATRPRAPERAHRLVFADPPYGSGLGQIALKALTRRGWIEAGALAIAEIGAKESFTPPTGFELLTARSFGAAHFVLMRYQDANNDPEKAADSD